MILLLYFGVLALSFISCFGLAVHCLADTDAFRTSTGQRPKEISPDSSWLNSVIGSISLIFVILIAFIFGARTFTLFF